MTAEEEEAEPPQEAPRLYCPSCHRAFPLDAVFCPFHGEKLVRTELVNPETGGGKSRRQTKGMICPMCHRGYALDARFCPHDAHALVPYREWRKKNVSIVIK